VKINEIINETADWIRTYWGLKSINIDIYKEKYDELLANYNESTAPIVNSLLMELYSQLGTLLSSSDWVHLESDPDYEKVYNDLLDVYESIENTLNQ
jgi:hypothetical protein